MAMLPRHLWQSGSWRLNAVYRARFPYNASGRPCAAFIFRF